MTRVPESDAGQQSWRRPPGFRREVQPAKDLTILASYLGDNTRVRILIVFAGPFMVLSGIGMRSPWGVLLVIGGFAMSVGQAWFWYYRHPESPMAHGQRS